jgi:hypothetical protein
MPSESKFGFGLLRLLPELFLGHGSLLETNFNFSQAFLLEFKSFSFGALQPSDLAFY